MAILSAEEYDSKVCNLRGAYRHRIEAKIAGVFGWNMVDSMMKVFDGLTVRQMECNSMIDMTGTFTVLAC